MEREALQIGELAHIIPQPYQQKSIRPAMFLYHCRSFLVDRRLNQEVLAGSRLRCVERLVGCLFTSRLSSRRQ